MRALSNLTRLGLIAPLLVLGVCLVNALAQVSSFSATVTFSLVPPAKYPGTGWPVQATDIAGYGVYWYRLAVDAEGTGSMSGNGEYTPDTTSITVPEPCGTVRYDVLAQMSAQATLNNHISMICVACDVIRTIPCPSAVPSALTVK